MKNNDLEKLFRDTFNKAEETPNPLIWNKIEEQLDVEEKIIPIKNKRNTWFYYIAASLLLIGTFSYIALKNNQNIDIHNTTNEYTLIQAESKDMEVNDKQVEPLTFPSPTLEKEKIKKHTVAIKKNIIAHQHIEKVTIEELPMEENITTLSKPDLNIAITPILRQVTEIEDIKPLIELDEESETMLATTNNENKNVITTILNTITENIDTKTNKELRFYADDEGSFGINIINSIAKNRNKKRK